MELIDKAENYAAEKTNEVIIKAIAQAYADGYRDGYKDREEEIPIDLRDNKTEYVDLGLPSGTLWAKEFENKDGKPQYLPYDIAKNMNLPTEEQLNELINECKWTMELGDFCCIGPNGTCLYFNRNGYYQAKLILSSPNDAIFWIIDNEDNGNFKMAGRFFNKNNNAFPSSSNYFSGYKLPVRLVRKK